MKLALLAISLLLAYSSRAEVVTAPNVDVNYDDIDEPQAAAIAQVLSAARSVYIDDFGMDMPARIVCDVKCSAESSTRLFTDGNDRVFLWLSDKSKLNRPEKSGVFNLYGLCQELGHMAMYSSGATHTTIALTARPGSTPPSSPPKRPPSTAPPSSGGSSTQPLAARTS
jgi:hypothetical protein